MKIEQQVSSRELSRRLRDLGVEQKSLFEYTTKGILDSENNIELNYGRGIAGQKECSAFTVAELGEFFPQDSSDIRIIHKKVAYDWYIKLEIIEQEKKSFKIVESYDNNEANARAKMLIYLLENKLIKI